MSRATLVIMAAGIGSRFGGGIKQLESVGPSGEIIMDYSIYDAIEAGFEKVVFVIRKDLEKDFKDVIGYRIEKEVEVAYAYQELQDIPAKYRTCFADRKKPWGTGQAILCCKDIVHEPFLVINADDYYGKEAYKEAFEYLTAPQRAGGTMELAMISFVLRNTLSEYGGVTRGVCKVDESGMLAEITETHGIEKKGLGAIVTGEAWADYEIDVEAPVSMNMFGMHPGFFGILEDGFETFLSSLPGEDSKKEYLLPTFIGNLLRQGEVCVKVLKSTDKWIGVTYKEDKAAVVAEMKNLVSAGVYPEGLFR